MPAAALGSQLESCLFERSAVFVEHPLALPGSPNYYKVKFSVTSKVLFLLILALLGIIEPLSSPNSVDHSLTGEGINTQRSPTDQYALVVQIPKQEQNIFWSCVEDRLKVEDHFHLVSMVVGARQLLS